MALMNLTLLKENPTLYYFGVGGGDKPLSHALLASHEEVEELLEAHLMDSNSLEAKINYLLVGRCTVRRSLLADTGAPCCRRATRCWLDS